MCNVQDAARGEAEVGEESGERRAAGVREEGGRGQMISLAGCVGGRAAATEGGALLPGWGEVVGHTLGALPLGKKPESEIKEDPVDLGRKSARSQNQSPPCPAAYCDLSSQGQVLHADQHFLGAKASGPWGSPAPAGEAWPPCPHPNRGEGYWEQQLGVSGLRLRPSQVCRQRHRRSAGTCPLCRQRPPSQTRAAAGPNLGNTHKLREPHAAGASQPGPPSCSP